MKHSPSEYRECPSCELRPPSQQICEMCRHNRDLINQLWKDVNNRRSRLGRFVAMLLPPVDQRMEVRDLRQQLLALKKKLCLVIVEKKGLQKRLDVIKHPTNTTHKLTTVEAEARYRDYKHGWIAAVHIMSDPFYHPAPVYLDAYDQGWEDGGSAYAAAMRKCFEALTGKTGKRDSEQQS